MSIKLLLLKSGDQVIADAKELVRKDSDKLYSYVLNKPHKVTATTPILLSEDVDKENYKFENYKFDHIHVCLSPQYIPKNHWHYFSMFINTYEHFHEKDARIENKKFEHDFRYRILGNEILH